MREADRAFVFTGGCVTLDLVATLGRRRSDAPVERMPDPSALARWLTESGLVSRVPEPTADELRRAWELREAVHHLLRPVDEQTWRDEAVAVVNEVAAGPALGDELVVTPDGLRAGPRAGTAGEALSRIAREAVALLGGPDAARIKECEHPDCSLLFLDETQARRRRWCSMERCGNLVKTAGYRARRRSGARDT